MMNRGEAILGLIKNIKEIDSFSVVDRQYAHKIAYILQEGFELPISYYFNCNIRGPYSMELARDIEKIGSTRKISKTIFKKEEHKSTFEKAEEFFTETDPSLEEIEIFATTIEAYKEEKEKDRAMKIMKYRKPFFDETKLEDAWKTLSEYDLLPE